MNISGFKVTKTVSVGVKTGANTCPHKITVGNFSVQPTGGYSKAVKKTATTEGKPKVYSTNTEDYNWTYCYFGVYDDAGNHVAGFSMDNLRMLQLVDSKVFGDGMRTAFEKFAESHPSQCVINAKTLEMMSA